MSIYSSHTRMSMQFAKPENNAISISFVESSLNFAQWAQQKQAMAVEKRRCCWSTGGLKKSLAALPIYYRWTKFTILFLDIVSSAIKKNLFVLLAISSILWYNVTSIWISNHRKIQPTYAYLLFKWCQACESMSATDSLKCDCCVCSKLNSLK